MSKYKLYNGDCLEIMDKLIEEGVKVDCILTDPPYGTTACKWDVVIPFDEMWERLNKLVKPNGAIVLFGSEPFSSALRMSNVKNYRYDWIWEKSYSVGFMNSNKMPLRKTERISVFYSKLPTYNPQGIVEVNKKQIRKKDKNTTVYSDMGLKEGEYIQKFSNYPTDIIKSTKKEKTVHPTQKPTDLLEYLIKTYTNENELVLDFTMGSRGIRNNIDRKFSAKDGNRCQQEKPIGTISKWECGYARIKTGKNEWEFIQRYVWKEHHGEIPPGHSVIFLDGNTDNYNIENLALVNRDELMKYNSMRLNSDNQELNRVAVNLAKLMTKAKEKGEIYE